MKIVVIGIQGDVSEHINSVERAFNEAGINGDVIWARNKDDLEGADGIIIPGGESTTIGKLMFDSGMDISIKKLASQDIPILGTCAGAILLAYDAGTEAHKTAQKLINLINIKIDRNAYGRQKDSFEAIISTSVGETKGVFIRAPLIKEILEGAETFATCNRDIVGAKQGNVIALTFHPELSGDTKIHRYFLELVIKQMQIRLLNNLGE